jgi:DNA-binding phage protein
MVCRKSPRLARESLYHFLSADGNPSLETVIKVLGILGYQFSIEQKKRYQHQKKTEA